MGFKIGDMVRRTCDYGEQHMVNGSVWEIIKIEYDLDTTFLKFKNDIYSNLDECQWADVNFRLITITKEK